MKHFKIRHIEDIVIECKKRIAIDKYPIIGCIDVTDNGKKISETQIIDMPSMSDYKWQLDCLKDRIEHPEVYEKIEDVQAAITQLQKWLEQNKPTDESLAESAIKKYIQKIKLHMLLNQKKEIKNNEGIKKCIGGCKKGCRCHTGSKV